MNRQRTPEKFTYQAHSYWNRVWRDHYGPSRYASRKGQVGIITLDPIKKTPKGIGCEDQPLRFGLDTRQDRALAR